MPVLLAASITYLDDKKAILKHWSGINAPEYHTTINEDLTVLCLPGVKKKHKWTDADGVISLWWLGRKSSDSDDVRSHLLLSLGANILYVSSNDRTIENFITTRSGSRNM